MILSHDLGTSLTLTRPGATSPLWSYVYGGKPKPFFHPLTTPAGYTLSIFEPSDHVWQRGLWFAIKFVNGHNFWEEKEHPFATQVTQAPPDVSHNGPMVTVDSTLVWHGSDGSPLMDEMRTFDYSPIDQDAYALDFTITLMPRVDVEFNRTPFNGKWGGYGGMAFRGNRNWLNTKLLFDDGTQVDRPIPKTSKWCDLTGLIDGGRECMAGVAMFDHPDNVRHPVGWYGGIGSHHYFNAAFLFHEPLTVPNGQAITFQYRVLVHDHVWSADRLNAAWEAWAKCE